MSATRKISALTIILNALKKMSPRTCIGNPILSIVFITACLATILLIQEITFSTGHIALYTQMVFWIWMTLFFSTLADSYAESKLGYTEPEDTDKISSLKIKRISKISEPDDFKEVELNQVKSGNFILLNSGDVVPLDGIIVKGACYVNETSITGGLGNNLKKTNKDNILTAGTIIEGSDSIIMKVSFSRKFSFLARSKGLLKKINRQSLPSELALQRLILGLSILFLSVIFTVWVIARYSGFDIPPIYILDLIVILLPTTISGLQHAIIIFGKAKLHRSDIIVHDHIALDNVVDVNVILLDKTGTLTVGKRQMTAFESVSDLTEQKCMQYLFLSSAEDSTHEGQSIKSFAERHCKIKANYIKKTLYKNLPFSASKPNSGCNYNDLEIRKGSVHAIAKYIGKSVDKLPANILAIIKTISEAHGTPILIAVNKKIIGVLHLRDRFRKGIMKQINRLHAEGVQIIMLTGDNTLTASYMAEKLGIKTSYAEATPEKKLELIKDLQQKGYVVAMCGDGTNDALALAQADIGFTFENNNDIHSIMSGNIFSKSHDLSALLDLKHICKHMTARRGALTVFSLASDLTKYFLIVPALFTTAFPPLSVLNFMHFRSLESIVLASVMFNALIILILTPIIFKDYNRTKSKYSLWTSIMLYGAGGVISPFICIKLLETFIYKIGLL
jgi:K+-transporting ATPase ATPase B chain